MPETDLSLNVRGVKLERGDWPNYVHVLKNECVVEMDSELVCFVRNHDTNFFFNTTLSNMVISCFLPWGPNNTFITSILTLDTDPHKSKLYNISPAQFDPLCGDIL